MGPKSSGALTVLGKGCPPRVTQLRHTCTQTCKRQRSCPPPPPPWAETYSGEQTQWAFTHTALSGLGVAGCGQSCMAKADDSGGGSEGHSLTERPGKHCSESRSDFLGTCLGLPYGPA